MGSSKSSGNLPIYPTNTEACRYLIFIIKDVVIWPVRYLNKSFHLSRDSCNLSDKLTMVTFETGPHDCIADVLTNRLSNKICLKLE